MSFTEMFAYTQAGLTSGKRLQVNETFNYYINGVFHQNPQTLNLDTAYTYDTEGRMTSVNYPSTLSYNGTAPVTTPQPRSSLAKSNTSAPWKSPRRRQRRAMIEAEPMTSREELHKIIDALPEDQIAEVREYVEELRGEEKPSEQTLAAIREGLDDIQNGRVMDVQEYRRTRGL